MSSSRSQIEWQVIILNSNFESENELNHKELIQNTVDLCKHQVIEK